MPFMMLLLIIYPTWDSNAQTLTKFNNFFKIGQKYKNFLKFPEQEFDNIFWFVCDRYNK